MSKGQIKMALSACNRDTWSTILQKPNATDANYAALDFSFFIYETG